jgi:hypothetical protein
MPFKWGVRESRPTGSAPSRTNGRDPRRFSKASIDELQTERFQLTQDCRGVVMKARFVLWSVLMVVFCFPSSSPTAADSGCVICHTNDAILKTLYKPPVIHAGEGEG